ncbi:hypothetical protein GQ53DRAFT_832551 [Thozetella sp. PMI_491]|nr:hypothetical protein GQ53DRAFT_832551 [Thozetella sp. PMI_491]
MGQSEDIKDRELELASHVEQNDPYGLSAEDRTFLDAMPDAAKKKAVVKADRDLIPLLTFLYLMSCIDRTNIGNVQTEGILDDLDLSGNRFNVAQCIFFLHLGGLVVSWGLGMTFSGFVQWYAGLIAVRFMLGVTDASFSVAAAGVVAASCLEFGYWSVNKRRAKKTEEEYREMYTKEQMEKMGDRSPLFKYAL